MEVLKVQDGESHCNSCLDRVPGTEAKIVIGGMCIKLCSSCRKKLTVKLVDTF